MDIRILVSAVLLCSSAVLVILSLPPWVLVVAAFLPGPDYVKFVKWMPKNQEGLPLFGIP